MLYLCKDTKIDNYKARMKRVAGQAFHNTNLNTSETLLSDRDNISSNLTNFIQYFSSSYRDIIDNFKNG